MIPETQGDTHVKVFQVNQKACEKKTTMRHTTLKNLHIISIYMIRLNYHTYIKCWVGKEHIPSLPHEFLKTS